MVMFNQRTHSSRDKGCLNGHKKNTFAHGTLFYLFSVLYVDDGEFPFEDRTQMKRGVELIFSHFTKFGLEMHIGRGGNLRRRNVYSLPLLGSFRATKNYRLHAKMTAMK